MIVNYAKGAIRSLLKYCLASRMNRMALVIGMTTCLLVILTTGELAYYLQYVPAEMLNLVSGGLSVIVLSLQFTVGCQSPRVALMHPTYSPINYQLAFI